MALSLKKEERLSEYVKQYLVLYEKQDKGYRDKDVKNTWNKVADMLEFVETGKVLLLFSFFFLYNSVYFLN